MELPRMIKLIELVPHINENVRVCMLCKYKGMTDYQKFYGSDAAKLPFDILNSLCVEKIGVELNIFSDGIVATLLISASDQATMITFDALEIFNQLKNQYNKSEPENFKDSEDSNDFTDPEEPEN